MAELTDLELEAVVYALDKARQGSLWDHRRAVGRAYKKLRAEAEAQGIPVPILRPDTGTRRVAAG